MATTLARSPTLALAARAGRRHRPRSPAPSGFPASKENTAAEGLELGVDQIARLNDLTPATGERDDEANMSTVDR